MWSFVFSAIFDSIWGWIGVGGVVAAAGLAVAWFIKPLRPYALAIAAAAIAAATIYTKGSRDRAALERRRKDEAIRKVRERYDEIKRTPDQPGDVERKLRDGSF